MDLVISHPVIKDKGIRNIYSGLHSHHLVGPRSCDTGERVIKEDIKHIHAKEKFRRSQLEYIPNFKHVYLKHQLTQPWITTRLRG